MNALLAILLLTAAEPDHRNVAAAVMALHAATETPASTPVVTEPTQPTVAVCRVCNGAGKLCNQRSCQSCPSCRGSGKEQSPADKAKAKPVYQSQPKFLGWRFRR